MLAIRSAAIVRLVLGLTFYVLSSSVAFAQPYDHLKCYKFRDEQVFDSVSADIETIESQFGLQNCQIKRKAKQFCVPASKTATLVLDGTDDPFAAQDLAYEQICYKVACPSETIADQQISDQFGTRTGSRFKASLLCVPAVIGPPPTTTTTVLVTTTTSTTSTLPVTFSLSAGDDNLPDQAANLAVDSEGNIVAIGIFYDDIDFGAGPLTSAGSTDIFIVKVDPTGAVIWNKSFGDVDLDTVQSVAIDTADRIVVTGSFLGSVDFGGGPLTSAGDRDGFIAKFDADGSHLWSTSFGGTASDQAAGVTIDSSGAIVFGGVFRSASVDFGGGPLARVGTQDGFVTKLTAAGTHVWSKSFGGASAQVFALGVAVDSADNVVFDGLVLGTVDFGGGALTGAGGDALVVKLTSGGSHVWSKNYGDASLQFAVRLAIDSLDNIIVSGFAGGTIDFGGGPLVSAGGNDIVLAKLDPAGAHVFSHMYGDTGDDQGLGVTTDAANNVLLCGPFTGTVDFGGGPTVSAGGQDVYLATFDASGTYVSVETFGDAAIAQQCVGVVIGPAGSRHIVGQFDGTIDFGNGPLTAGVTADVFITKLAP